MSTWREARDPILRDFANRLYSRKLFKTQELYGEAREEEPSQRLHQAARQIAQAHGFDPDQYIALDVASDVPFEESSDQLRVMFPKGPSKKPSEVSLLLGRLRGERLEAGPLDLPTRAPRGSAHGVRRKDEVAIRTRRARRLACGPVRRRRGARRRSFGAGIPVSERRADLPDEPHAEDADSTADGAYGRFDGLFDVGISGGAEFDRGAPRVRPSRRYTTFRRPDSTSATPTRSAATFSVRRGCSRSAWICGPRSFPAGRTTWKQGPHSSISRSTPSHSRSEDTCASRRAARSRTRAASSSRSGSACRSSEGRRVPGSAPEAFSGGTIRGAKTRKRLTSPVS